jgi:hypothetical protein
VHVVLAHELGHHSATTFAKAIGWFAIFALPGARPDAARRVARRDG